MEEGVGTKLRDEFLDVFLQAFSLIVEEEGCSGLLPSLGNVPCDAAFVGDAENDADFTCKGSVTHPTRKPSPSPSCHAKRRGSNDEMKNKIWNSVTQEKNQRSDVLLDELERRKIMKTSLLILNFAFFYS